MIYVNTGFIRDKGFDKNREYKYENLFEMFNHDDFSLMGLTIKVFRIKLVKF